MAQRITPRNLVLAGIASLVLYVVVVVLQSWIFSTGAVTPGPDSGTLIGIQTVATVLGLSRPLGATLIVGGLVLQGIRTLLAQNGALPNAAGAGLPAGDDPVGSDGPIDPGNGGNDSRPSPS